MKEHLYRGKSKESGKWVSGSLIIDGEEAYISQGVPGIEIDSDYWANSYGFPPNENDFHLTDIEEVDSSTVGQYWRTVNNQDLYDGDIFTVDGKCQKVVRYIDKYACFCVANTDELQFEDTFEIWQIPSLCWFSDFEMEIGVIGNIHDNKDLLK